MNPTQIPVYCTINFVPFDMHYTVNHDLHCNHTAYRFMVLYNNQTQLPLGRVMIAQYDLPNGDILCPMTYQRGVVYDDVKADSMTHHFPKEEYHFNTLEWLTTKHARMVWEGLVKNHNFHKLKMHPSSTIYNSLLLTDLMEELAKRTGAMPV